MLVIIMVCEQENKHFDILGSINDNLNKVSVWPTYLLLHLTHARMKDEENRHSRKQRKRSKLENFPCEECKQNKNRLTPVKLESKKQDKKVISQREG